jgi:uncharacterized membrane protein YfcA
VALIVLGSVLKRWRFKTVVAAGIGFGVLRYILYATNSTPFVLIGLSMHGVAFTFTYISMQIYLAERIEPSWRTRAQALLSLMTAGVGNLTGYLGCGVWFSICSASEPVQWTLYWSVLCALVVSVGSYFLIWYRDQVD